MTREDAAKAVGFCVLLGFEDMRATWLESRASFVVEGPSLGNFVGLDNVVAAALEMWFVYHLKVNRWDIPPRLLRMARRDVLELTDGELLEALRRKQGMTRKDAARLAGVTVPTIRRYETGETVESEGFEEWWPRVARALGVLPSLLTERGGSR
jgi:DNA-binding XRE family transcriptional regulator